MSDNGDRSFATVVPSSTISDGYRQSPTPKKCYALFLAGFMPKYTGIGHYLGDWIKRLWGLIQLYEIPSTQQAELAMNTLKGKHKRLILRKTRISLAKLLTT